MNVLRLILISLTLSLLSSQATEYNVKPDQQNLVKFISDAPIEDFEGVTSEIDGYLIWEGPDQLQNAKFYFEVDLNTLDTGIGLRNRHMRENYLECEKYPKASFEGKIVSVKKVADHHYQVVTEGEFYCHGVKQSRRIPGEIMVKGDQLQIKSNFDVKLSDHQIEIPSIMFYKIDETMKVIVNFTVQAVKE